MPSSHKAQSAKIGIRSSLIGVGANISLAAIKGIAGILGNSYALIADAVESLVNKEGLEVRVFGTKGRVFEIGASDQGALTALLLRRMRQKAGLSFPGYCFLYG